MDEFYIVFPITLILGLAIGFVMLLIVLQSKEHSETSIRSKMGWFLLSNPAMLYSKLSYGTKNVAPINESKHFYINSEDEYNRALIVIQDFQIRNTELFFIKLHLLTPKRKRDLKKISEEDLFVYYFLNYLNNNKNERFVDTLIAHKLLYITLLYASHNDRLLADWLELSALEIIIEDTKKTLSTQVQA